MRRAKIVQHLLSLICIITCKQKQCSIAGRQHISGVGSFYAAKLRKLTPTRHELLNGSIEQCRLHMRGQGR